MSDEKKCPTLRGDPCFRGKCALWVTGEDMDRVEGGCSHKLVAIALDRIDNSLMIIARHMQER